MVIIGAGRIGTALQQRASAHGIAVALVRRDEGWEHVEGLQGDPLWVAVRNDDVADVVAKVPSYRRDDLVFLQNGAIRPLLRDLGLASCTRGLLYFAVATRGGPLTEGLVSPFSGPHGLSSARFLGSIGLKAHSLDWARFSYYELEKLLWLSIHGLLCQKHGVSVGEVADHHREELDALVAELMLVGRAAMSVDAPADYVADRLVAYSRTIPSWSASVKELPYRDGWLSAAARRHHVATPLHDRLMAELGYAVSEAPTSPAR